ncbi:glutathione S-transferase family protein [Gemmobacter fulvus]|uniref:Glutathione S-transferase family protein n=1 Tax=Gemmobacter fulvus TaxID=2840474 RepID=A0A975P5P0_9RHOB|nr:glutathione S-transferase family protein [Gemmobacter fulvus]MBT9247386.1 glutathione S-transferase family protein [Gemmobacter fulvus]MDQ1848428.1 glutathione S-transferase family protein [Gemmobacter fulvus]QWK90135.1 glutathione S-transferase family protein [Gemmobacter fulvus]
MLTLYGCHRSRASRPIWLLHEIGMAFTHVPVIQAYRLPDPMAKDAPLHTASDSFLAINPQGQIPAMTEGDLVLTESLAICLHIARAHGGTLAPHGLAEQALTDQWALFAATGIEAAALAILYADPATPEGAEVIEMEAEKLLRPFERLDDHLTGRAWLLDRFTVADIMVAEIVRYAQGHAPLMQSHPAIAAWMSRCQSRPAFKAMWAARLAEPA